MATTIDLNGDVGESFGSWRMGDDDALLALVSSASVACGFHAGDAVTARATCARAARLGVTVGAHVGYRDLAGFGRRFLDVEPSELVAEVVYQIGALQALARTTGTVVRYVKPHGGLYNALVHHQDQAGAVVRALLEVDASLALMVLPGSVVARIAEAAGLRTVTEAFADRAYAPDGSLVPRNRPGAVLHDPDVIAARVVRMVHEGRVTAVDGSEIELSAQTICVHGDTPGAVAIATAVRQALASTGVQVTSAL